MSKTKIGAFAILSIVVALCVGCSRQLTEGEIVGKRYEPESTFVMMIPIAMSCGNNCTTTMFFPYLVHDDEDYILTVSGSDADGDLITEDWYVDRETYDRAETGRRHVYDDSHASRDDEHEKLGRVDD